MPRPRKTRLFPVGLSPAACAAAVNCSQAIIRAGIKLGALPCYKAGLRRIVLVEDLVKFVRTMERV
jgi:hypothetical protein